MWLIAQFIRVYSWTFRLTLENEREWHDYLEQGGPSNPLLLASTVFFRSFAPFADTAPITLPLMISRSADGTIIAGIANQMGWQTVRGILLPRPD